jgi:hypothetical protein
MDTKNKIEDYDAAEHIHRYAIWTAARSAQRGFTTTKIIGNAIKAVNLKKEIIELINKKEIAVDEFDKWHEEMCEKIESELKNSLKNNLPKKEVSFGRAAKIVNIYLKTSLVISQCSSDNPLVALIHPPIDRILLSNLIDKKRLPEEMMGNWTTMGKEKYLLIIKELRKKFPILWKAEEYWQLQDDE